VLYHVVLVLFVVFVFLGALPLVMGAWQFLLVGVHGFRNHLGSVGDLTPRTTVVVPAWNEAAVIGGTIDRLVSMDYPADALRVYVVDDASTDATPDVIQERAARYPGQVFHVRREKGGEGKAHTLNHGIGVILADDWCEALLVIDADVIFEDDTLRKMTRHFADPRVGAVTAYIKEGTDHPNYVNRFVGFEYITAQAAARRSQNVLGAMACLAGGAQLHTRTNLEAIGGRIDTSSLAEDTFTTFETQLHGRRAVFDPAATVWAEEPGALVALWKQRLRWGRGNVQVTSRYRRVWFRRWRVGPLGGFSFGLQWFAIFLMPVFLILGTISLIALYFLDRNLSLHAFRVLWIISGVTYVFVTAMSLAIDPYTAKRTWREGILFPGVISLLIILAAFIPQLFDKWIPNGLHDLGIATPPGLKEGVVLFSYAWLSLSMLVAYAAKRAEQSTRLKWLAAPLLYTAGYGPFLCAVTFASYVYEARGAEMRWDKTEKTGKVRRGELKPVTPVPTGTPPSKQTVTRGASDG
jgi:cellulose synthase/poly-beta-1,6-N-acetylglucosamine synthase-like glycosyltransferase